MAATPFPSQPLAFTLHYVRRHRGPFALVAGLVMLAAIGAVAVQYAMKLLVDAMDAGSPAMAAVWPPLAAFAALIAAENLLWRLAGWLGCRTVVGAGVAIRLDLFDRLSAQPMAYFTKRLSGSLGTHVTAATGAFGTLVSTTLWNILPPCTELVGAVVVLVTIDPVMAGALIAATALMALGLGAFGARGGELHRDYAHEAADASGEIVDTVANIWAVKAFSARAQERRRLAARLEQEAAQQRRSWLYLEKTRILHDVGLWCMAIGMLAWSLKLWSEALITIGDVVVVSALTFRILHGARDLAFALITVGQQMGQIGASLQVIGLSHPLADEPGARPLVPRGGAIRFERVTFTYGDRPVFRDFDLEIAAGQSVGLVGPSGAGKSTLIGLVQRLHDPIGGRVLIDGQGVAEVTQDSLRAAIAVVPQETILFNRSVGENIRFGRPGASDAEVVAAARAARCAEFIEAMPEGYDTAVGERGLRLSGGQRQRIAIARAILKDAPIILLDEATSALDTSSERDIQAALVALMRGRTVLAIAHRLSTLTAFDRVIVLEAGRVFEDGRPSQLVRRDGAFAALWRMQSGGLSQADEAAASLAPG